MRALFGRHAREFGRAIQRQEYERTPEGVYFPRQCALLFGEFRVMRPDGAFRQRNLVCNGGLAVLGNLAGAIQSLDFCMAPFTGDTTPEANWNELDLYLAGEMGDAPDGYDETSRVAWACVNEGGQVLGNSASPAAFTIRTTEPSVNVYGFAITGGFTTAKLSGISGVGFYDVTTQSQEAPDAERVTPRGTVRQIGIDVWLDPSSDDFFDAFSGTWQDPSSNALGPFDLNAFLHINTYVLGGISPLFAACRFDTPQTFTDGDPLNVTYQLAIDA